MEIVKTKNDLIPLRGIPEGLLNKIIVEDFSPWITKLLAIKPTDENVSRLEVLLPMIKDNCWSMSLQEIKKAFLMYAQGKLSVEPRDNYLTIILFSQVITAYKQQAKPPVKLLDDNSMKVPDSKEIAIESLKMAYDEYKSKGKVSECYASSFDRLYDWGILPSKENEKAQKYYDGNLKRAHVFIHLPIRQKYARIKNADLHDTKEGKELLKRVKETNDYNHPAVQNKFRCYVLEDFFKKYTWEQIEKKL